MYTRHLFFLRSMGGAQNQSTFKTQDPRRKVRNFTEVLSVMLLPRNPFSLFERNCAVFNLFSKIYVNFMANLAFRTGGLSGWHDTRARGKREAKIKLPVVTQCLCSTAPLKWLTWKDWEERLNLLARNNVSSNGGFREENRSPGERLEWHC